jgi:hypothetical protein
MRHASSIIESIHTGRTGPCTAVLPIFLEAFMEPQIRNFKDISILGVCPTLLRARLPRYLTSRGLLGTRSTGHQCVLSLEIDEEE